MESANIEPQNTLKTSSKKRIQRIALWSIGIAIIIAVGITTGILLAGESGPISKAIRSSISTPVYYPDKAKLPKGYVLDTTSFQSPQPNTLLYSVKYGDGQTLLFSLQPKPSDEEIQRFYSNHIPLRNQVKTPAGRAEIGAYNNADKLQTIVSLPTNDDTWILITAPSEIDQSDLKKVLNSLTRD